MSDIEISVDLRQVKAAKNDMEDLKKSFSSAYQSATVFMKAFERTEAMNRYTTRLNEAIKANQSIINTNLGVSNSYKSAQDSAQVFTQVLKNQEEQAKKLTEAFNERVGITGFYKSAADSAEVFQAAAKKESDAWFAQQRRRLDMIRASEAMTAQAANGYSGFGFAVQQAGYQVGDFFVQVQSGTNPLVAFGQQATQLVYVIPELAREANIAKFAFMGLSIGVGTLTAALGIVIPIVTMLGAAWMRTSEQTEEASNTFDETTKQLKDRIDRLQLDNLKIKFNADEDSVAKTLQELESINASIELTKAKVESIKKTYEDIVAVDVMGNVVGGSPNMSSAEDQVLSILEQQRKEKEAQLATEKKLREQAAAREAEEQRLLTAAKNRANEVRDIYRILQKQKEEVMQQYEWYGKTRAESERLVTAVEEALASGNEQDFQSAMEAALDAGISFSNLDLETPVIKAMNAAGRLAANMMAALTPVNKPFIPSSGLGMEPVFSPLAPRVSPKPRPFPGMDTGLPDLNTGTGGGGGQSPEQIIADMTKQLELQKALVGTSDEYKNVVQAVGLEYAKAHPQIVQGLVDQMQALDELMEKEKERQQLFDSIQSTLEDGFMSMIDGTKSVKDAFKSMAYDIIKDLYRVFVIQRMIGSFNFSTGQGSGMMGLIGTGISSAVGGVSSAPKPAAPPMSRIAAPSKSDGVTVVQNINVTGTGDAAYVRSEVAKMMPQITGATKAAVIDARKRGGQMAAAFK